MTGKLNLIVFFIFMLTYVSAQNDTISLLKSNQNELAANKSVPEISFPKKAGFENIQYTEGGINMLTDIAPNNSLESKVSSKTGQKIVPRKGVIPDSSIESKADTNATKEEGIGTKSSLSPPQVVPDIITNDTKLNSQTTNIKSNLTTSTTIAINSTSTSTTTTTTTSTTSKPTKPHITHSLDEESDNSNNMKPNEGKLALANEDKNSDNFEKPAYPPNNSLGSSINIAIEMKAQGHPDYIAPVVITIFVLPLFVGLTVFLVRKGRDFWEKRHYRRMDFLIDGMYND